MEYEKTVAIVSLGCSKNRADSEEMMGLLMEAGYTPVALEDIPEVVIVNTCGFIEDAKNEAREALLECLELKKRGVKFVIGAGCYTQRYKDSNDPVLSQLDAMVGVTAFEDIVEVIKGLENNEPKCAFKDISAPCPEGLPRYTEEGATYGYIKIAEGCDNRCSYCAIPYIRGNFRSKGFDSLMAEARTMARRGISELIIIAQDITRYGQDIDKASLEGVGVGYTAPLAKLVYEMSKIEGVRWIRLMYLNPARVTRALIDELMSIPKVLPYFDIPIQHINDRMLTLMNRPALSEHIKDIFTYIKEAYPAACLRTTLIVGFPTETDEEAEELVALAKGFSVDNLGAFIYSPEEGTPACEMEGRIPYDVAEVRYSAVMSARKGSVKKALARRIGTACEVVIEGAQSEGVYYGRSYGEAPDIDGVIYVFSDKEHYIGEYVNVKITKRFDYDLVGVIPNEG